MQIAVIGSGYVGLVAAAGFAELGHNVVCVDNDLEKIATLNAGGMPIHEDYLQEVVSRHHGKTLFFSGSLADAVTEAKVIFIAVGTPAGPDGEVDLSYVEAVAREIARCAAGHKLIVEKSTVPVYTSEWIRLILESNSRRKCAFDVASNPEFLREGTAVTDFLYPDRIVVGADSDSAARILREIYAPLIDASYSERASAVPKPDAAPLPPLYLETSAKSAEIIKHASNAFLAMKISFINAVANICEAVDADVDEVSQGIGSDTRIGSQFLRAGIGYGGACFPKDVDAFRAAAQKCGVEFSLLEHVRRINEGQRELFIEKVRIALGELGGKRLGVLGLAFKGGTDDIRESPALKIVDSLLREGCHIRAYDPAAMGRTQQIFGSRIDFAVDSYSAAKDADALLILTEWKEFASLDLTRIRRGLKHPVLVDGRNLYSPREVKNAGLEYYSVGRPLPAGSRSATKLAAVFSNGHGKNNGHAKSNGHTKSNGYLNGNGHASNGNGTQKKTESGTRQPNPLRVD
jgi:UDPglucose 6-dehydrogenase